MCYVYVDLCVGSCLRTLYICFCLTPAARDTDRFGQPIPLDFNDDSEKTVIDDKRERSPKKMRAKLLKKQRKLKKIMDIVQRLTKHIIQFIRLSVRASIWNEWVLFCLTTVATFIKKVRVRVIVGLCNLINSIV